MSKKAVPVAERFWNKVQKTDTCWNWTAGKIQGYGMIAINRKGRRAHRWSYEQKNGPIPDGLVIDHLCRNRACVNPDHLEAVTNRENVLRGDTEAARHSAQVVCKYGHDDWKLNDKGWRHCLQCDRNHAAAQRAARRAEKLRSNS